MSLILDRHKGAYRARVDVDALTARFADQGLAAKQTTVPVPEFRPLARPMGSACKQEFFDNVVRYLHTVYGVSVVIDYVRLRRNMDEYVDDFS